MLERTIILPDLDNDGVSLASEQTAFETRLLDLCGGFTSDNVRGAWRDETGHTFYDASHRYIVALTEHQDIELAAILPETCAACRQACLYTSVRPLDVEFVCAPIHADEQPIAVGA